MAFHANKGNHGPTQGDTTVFFFFFLKFSNVFFLACGLWSLALLRSITSLHHYTDTDTDDCEHTILLYVAQ